MKLLDLMKRTWPWLAWGLSSLVVAYQFILQSSLSMIIPDLVKNFSVDAQRLSWLSSCFFSTYLLAQAPAGVFIDRFGPRWILSCGLMIACVCGFLFAYTSQWSIVELTRVIMGAALAPAFSSALYVAATWFRSDKFPLLVGLTETLIMGSVAIGEFLFAELVKVVGWRGSFFYYAFFGLTLALLLAILLRNKVPEFLRKKNQLLNQSKAVSHQKESIENKSTFLEVLKNKHVWKLGFFAGCGFSVFPIFSSLWGVSFFQSLYGISKEMATGMNSFLFIGTAVGAPAFGFLVNYYHPKLLMRFGILAEAVFMAIVLYLNLPWYVMAVVMFLLGITSAIYIVAFACVPSVVDSSARATAVALVNILCMFFGTVVLQLIIGYLLDWFMQSQYALTDARNILAYRKALFILPAAISLGSFIIHPHKLKKNE